MKPSVTAAATRAMSIASLNGSCLARTTAAPPSCPVLSHAALCCPLRLQDDSVAVPERYLGLCMPHEQGADAPQPDKDDRGSTTTSIKSSSSSSRTASATPPAQQQAPADSSAAAVPAYLARLAQHVSQHVDLALLLQVAAKVPPPDQPPAAAAAADTQHQQEGCGSQAVVQLVHQAAAAACPSEGRAEHAMRLTRVPGPCCRIAVARDEAFCFYYQVGVTPPPGLPLQLEGNHSS